MNLIIQCPVCSQGLLVDRPHPNNQALCPSCKARINIRNPRLPEQEILRILYQGPAHN